ncbi:hypothetical protein [Merismopedia glauca]|uniref:Uncharacterized protein n=1 Tax=Merismopedia glauca CCAP 1448/3 TaxID=1296344 RepID=A0A2T1C098_9CYAN|nr:hypothetical protein [Merismopedia glauca]PSB01699.1 hypothetical protein C7B64_17080 [Merismopedia glauca CCAP 1448/3]
MKWRYLSLLMLVVVPGIATTTISLYYMFPEWKALDASYQNYTQVAKSPNSKVQDILIAEAAENRHRLNCFAEGIGTILGLVIISIGIHGICTLSPSKSSL